MLRLEETLNRLQQVQITQGQANSTITAGCRDNEHKEECTAGILSSLKIP